MYLGIQFQHANSLLHVKVVPVYVFGVRFASGLLVRMRCGLVGIFRDGTLWLALFVSGSFVRARYVLVGIFSERMF